MPLPRTWKIAAVDIVAVLVANGVVILAMWLRHDGLDQLSTLGGQLTAIGQLTGLYAAYLALIQLVLMSRSPWLDQVFGMDGLAVAHRWLGFATVWLLLGHGVFIVTGYALGDGSNVVEEAITLVTTYPYVLMASVSGALFGLVAITSIRAARRRLSYETWYGLHLYAYLAIALGFLHQLFVGADFIHDPIAVGYWVALYVITAAFILVFRIGQPVWLSTRHQLRVANVVDEAPGRLLDLRHRSRPRPARGPLRPVLHVAVPDPRRLVAGASVLDLVGAQRCLAADHDQGVSATGRSRSSASRSGRASFVEGPYGVLTGARRTRQKVLLIAGGIGITPLRALLEALPANPGDLTLLYRVRSAPEILFRDRARRAGPATRSARSTTSSARAARASATRSTRRRSPVSCRTSPIATSTCAGRSR